MEKDIELNVTNCDNKNYQGGVINGKKCNPDDLKEPEKPVGDFILEYGKGTQTENGMFYHYSEVCKLLKDYKREK